MTRKNPDLDTLQAVRGSKPWKLDAKSEFRLSHENPDVQTLYRAYLKAPLSGRSHHLMHTEHTAGSMLGE